LRQTDEIVVLRCLCAHAARSVRCHGCRANFSLFCSDERMQLIGPCVAE